MIMPELVSQLAMKSSTPWKDEDDTIP